MRSSPCLSVAFLLALPALAEANCYTIYDTQNRLAFQSTIAPIDLSRRISEAMPGRFPGGYLVMIPDESACSEFLSGLTATQPRFVRTGANTAPSSDQVMQASPLLRGSRTGISANDFGTTSNGNEVPVPARSGTTLNVKRPVPPARP